MANEISKIKLPGGTTEYTVKDNSAITNITRSGTTFTATKRDGTEFTFTQQDNNTTYTFATGDNDGQIKVTPSGGTAQNVSVKGLGAAAYKGTTTSVTSGSSDLVTSGAVYTAIDNLPEPMIFKGSLGTGGTITTLPTASSANEGFTYKVITTGTYASQAAKVGDLFISNGTDWIWIPSGDEPSGTVTSVAAGTGLDGGTITTSGTLSVKYGTAAGTACQGNDSRLSDARTPTSHTHGNIQNGGTLQTNDITIANGDKLVVTDSSDSAKVARTSISFDGSTATKALTQKGTWETFGTSNLAIGTTATTALAGNTKYAGASTAGGSATSAAKLDTATAGSAIQPCYFANGIPSACTYTLGKSVPSTAEFTDSKVAVTPTNPPSATWYFPVWDTGGGTHGLMANDGFQYCSMQGTESVAGYSIIQAGNNIATGTAGNKSGEVRIYSQTDYCSRLVMTSNPTGSRTHTLPNVDGTIGVFTATPTSGQVVVTDGTAGGFKTTGYTIATSVPNNAVFTDTTYTLSADTTHYKIKLTPSNGTAQSITVPYATISSQVGQISIGHSTKPMYLDAGVPKECTYTLGKSVPSDAVFTDTNNKVTQTDTTTSMDLRVLLSQSANDTTETDYVRKSSNLTFNPSTGTLTSTNFVGSLTGAASKLGTSDKGSATQPIYLVLGVPYACTYTLEKSVPSDAVFTDHYAWTDITGKPSSFTPASHTHGNIQNGGTLQTNDITIASGDKLVVTDSSDSSKVARTSISFDGSTTTKCLTQKGTWATFGTSNLTLGTTASTALKGDTKYAGASTAGGSATSAAKLDTSTAGSATKPCYFVNGVPSACTYSLNKTVPSDAVFTDTNNAVTQTATTTSANYELLFSATADNTTRTEGARKTDSLKYNPSTKELTLDGTIVLNGYSRTTSTDPCPSLILKAKNIDTDTAVSARTYSNSEINVHDKDGDRLGFMNWFKDTDGSIGFALSAQNKSTGGTSYYNTLEMRVDKTGNKAYSVSDTKAFRTAINDTTITFTKSTTALSGNIGVTRKGNVCTITIGNQITTAGSYTQLGTISPKPAMSTHFLVALDGALRIMRVQADGSVVFNNATAVSANAWLIGSCTYITAD